MKEPLILASFSIGVIFGAFVFHLYVEYVIRRAQTRHLNDWGKILGCSRENSAESNEEFRKRLLNVMKGVK